MEKFNTYFCDIDGTIFNYRKFETYKTSEPEVIPSTLEFLNVVKEQGHMIILTTARPEDHRWLIDQRLNEGKNVLICIRDVEPDENQPFTPTQVYRRVSTELSELINEGRVKVIVIPDIESVNYGRGVGYEIIEHVPPTDIKEVSATKIREQMRKDGKL